jgi:putative DNA primase/helicase
MIMGVAKGSAVKLFPFSKHLGVAEGIENALVANQLSKMPVWAALSADGVRSFPLIHGISRLIVFADNDDAGLSAARACGLRYSKAGIDVEIRYPPVPGSDWNDFLQMEYGNGTDT